MITEHDLLNNPKYREMEYRKLRDYVMRMDRYDYEILMVKLRVKLDVSLTDALMEYYKNNPLKPKQMKKSDIKHPMILIRRNGLKYCVVPNIENGWRAYNVKGNYLVEDNYTDDLLDRDGDRNFDIMQVLDHDGTVLWEREGKKYMVGVAEMDDNMELHSISAEKAERIKKIIKE